MAPRTAVRSARPRAASARSAGRRAPARSAAPARAAARRPAPQHQWPELTGLALIAVGLILAPVAYAGWNGGYVGGWVVDGLHAVVGSIVYVVPLALAALGVLLIARSEVVDVRPFRHGSVVCVLGLGLVLGARHGGYLGRGLHALCSWLIGDTGTFVLGVFTLVAGCLLVTGGSLGAFLRRSHASVQERSRQARRRREAEPKPARRSRERRAAAGPAPLPELANDAPASTVSLIDAETAFPDVVEIVHEPPSLPVAETSAESHEEHPPAELFPRYEPVGEYTLPDRNVLKRSKRIADNSAETSARIASAIVSTLAHFGIEAQMVGQVSGPRVTRYELQLSPGTPLSKFTARRDDLCYALATTEIRILAPIPGKQAVGVEVPNPSANLVTLGDIVGDLPDLPAAASPLSVWLGKDIAGNPVWADLARMPHLLIAGTTGSGKSGCINALLTSVLMRATPDEVRMILIDPKRVELSFYESIPHLLTPVVSSPKQAAAALLNVVGEMERRYERMSLLRARSLRELNRALRQRGDDPLPYLLVVIDELADLMMVSPQDVEESIIRLAQKSRAVGIHLVLATQRPSVDVITGMIKANVPSRIAFAVSSLTDSRVILDTGGAEALLGQGDMLYKPLGESRLTRVQGAYVSEEEVALVVEQCRSQRTQELDESILEAPERGRSDDDEDGDDLDPDEDPLLDRAIAIAVETQTASVSLIQRRLRVGYTRAGRLIDMLERRGVISGYEGSKPRRVLIAEADLDRFVSGVRQPDET